MSLYVLFLYLMCAAAAVYMIYVIISNTPIRKLTEEEKCLVRRCGLVHFTDSGNKFSIQLCGLYGDANGEIPFFTTRNTVWAYVADDRLREGELREIHRIRPDYDEAVIFSVPEHELDKLRVLRKGRNKPLAIAYKGRFLPDTFRYFRLEEHGSVFVKDMSESTGIEDLELFARQCTGMTSSSVQ